MKVSEHTFPWKHWVIDDFLPEEEFKYIQTVTKKWTGPRSSFEKLNLRLDDFKFYEETFMHYEECMKVKEILTRAAKKLEEHFQVAGQYQSLHLEYVNCGRDFYYRVHKDSKEKLMSHVLYVSEDGDGTRLFSNINKDDETCVDWKPNRVVSFKANNVSYHDYYSTIDNRITFNICFVLTKIKYHKPALRAEKDLTLRVF